jgi:hypothetical protein
MSAARVRNPFGSGIAVVQDRGLEAEADRMGQRAACYQETVQAKPASPARVASPAARQPFPPMMPPRATPPGATLGAVQRSAPVIVSGINVTLAGQDDSGTGRLKSWYKNMGFAPVGSNGLGYPVLEAPITRALPGVVQGCIFPAPSSAGTLCAAGTRQPAAVLQRAEGMTDERALALTRAKFSAKEYDTITWKTLGFDPLVLEFVRKRSGGLSQFKKDLKNQSAEYKQIAKATADAKAIEATAKQQAANKLARIEELKTGYGSHANWTELLSLGAVPRVEWSHDGPEPKPGAANAHVACFDVWWTAQNDASRKWCLHIHFSKANKTAANAESAHFKRLKNHQAGNNAGDFGESAACALVGIT